MMTSVGRSNIKHRGLESRDWSSKMHPSDETELQSYIGHRQGTDENAQNVQQGSVCQDLVEPSNPRQSVFIKFL